MENKKLIDKKSKNNTEYRLFHWTGDDVYIIYKFDKSIEKISHRPEIFKTKSKKEAEEKLIELTK